MSRSKTIQKMVMICLTVSVIIGKTGCVVVNTPPAQNKINQPVVTSGFTLNTDPTISPASLPTDLTYSLDFEAIEFPPVSDAKEAYEKGEYEEGLRDINQWMSVWDRLGFFDGSIKVDQLKPVVLDGRARIVCVASKDDKYTKTLYCPQIDMVNGGLRSVPETGKEQESDQPLIINLENLEGLISRGKDNGMVYQFIDKYTKKSIRYIDAKTGNIVEGSYRAPLEVEENELVEKSTICVADEFCMGGQMEIDSESAKIFYKGFLTALVQSKENKEYFESILGDDLSYEALIGYLDRNEGKIPSGLRIIRDEGRQYFSMTLVVDEPVNLSTLKVITFGPKEWKNNEGNIQEYINSYEKKGLSSIVFYDGVSLFTYGSIVDDKGFLVLVSGSKDYEQKVSTVYPIPIMGEKDGNYDASRDNMIATATFLSWIKYMERDYSRAWRMQGIVPLSNIPDDFGATREDVNNFFGNKTLFLDKSN